MTSVSAAAATAAKSCPPASSPALPVTMPRCGMQGVEERDMNHGGRFTKRRSRPSGAGALLFHRGGSSATWSAGCQALPDGEWDRSWRAVRSVEGALVDTLVQG